jgi:hypothetical protein
MRELIFLFWIVGAYNDGNHEKLINLVICVRKT